MIIKTIAILLNIGWVIFISTMFFMYNGWEEPLSFLALFAVITTAIINLIVICLANENSWFALFLKRKALEEKEKIEKLKKHNG